MDSLLLLLNSIVLLILLYNQINIRKFTGFNIILGVKVPDDEVNNEELDLIYSNYKRMLIIAGIVFILTYILIGLANISLEDIFSYIFISQVLYVLLLFFVRLRYNKKIKALKASEGWAKFAKNTRVTDIKYTRDRERINGLLSWGKLPILIVLANLTVGIYMYPKLPLQINALWGFSSDNPYVYKGLWNVFSGILLQLLIICLVYMNYYTISKTRLEIDPDKPKDSIEFNKKYVKKWSNILLANLIFVTLILSYFNMYVLGFVVIYPTFLYLYKLLSYLIIIGNVYMISKIRMDNLVPSVAEIEARQYYLEDDKFWKLGSTIYYNPNDSALFVKSRFGPGNTVNVAKPLGMVIVILSIGIICLAVLMAINMDFVLEIMNEIL